MLAAAAMVFATGAAAFTVEEAPLPFVSMNMQCNPFRHADLDRDGLEDLVSVSQVLFQRDGRFPIDARAPFPHVKERPVWDLWNDVLYLIDEKGLRTLRWTDGQWESLSHQEIDWPEGWRGRLDTLQSPSQQTSPERFLTDLDGDGEPEILLPLESGIDVYRRIDGLYAEAGSLNVYPPPRLARSSGEALWPSSERTLDLPVLETFGMLRFARNTVSVLHQEQNRTAPAYQVTHYDIALNHSGRFEATARQRTTTAPMPPFMYPFQLNSDDVPDFVGIGREKARGDLMGLPVYVISATTDLGKTIQTVRTHLSSGARPFVDFDGDGDMDMVSVKTSLAEGGIRERLTLILTRHVVEAEVRVHLQNSRGVFSKEPAIARRFAIELPAPLFRPGRMRTRYWNGELVRLDGDYNGDGYRDALVREREDRLAVYLYQRGRFASAPAAALEIEPDSSYMIADINADGRSDVVVFSTDFTGDQAMPNARVHLSGLSE